MSRTSTNGSPARPVALALLALASVLSLWLVHLSLSAGPIPGCDGGECGLVLGSKWAKVFGVPVGLFGAASYLGLIALAARPFASGQRGPRIVGAALVLLIPAAALWFVALQMFVLHAFCKWCCTTHAIATTGALLTAWTWRRESASAAAAATGSSRRAARAAARPVVVWGPAAGLAGAAFAGFLGAQALSPEAPRPHMITASMNSTSTPAATPAPLASTPKPTNAIAAPGPSVASADTNQPAPAPAPAVPIGPRRLVLHEGRFSLDPHAFPVNGSPDAEQLMMMMSDYTCPHCRAAYKILKEVRQVFDEKRLGIVMLPSHHGGDSQELQQLLLSTWKADPAVWAEVSSDLYLEKLPLKPETVRQVLTQRLGPGRLEAFLDSSRPWIASVFDLSKEVHAANRAKAGSGSIPQFILGSQIVVGAPADAAEFYGLLEKNLGLVRDRYPEMRLGTNEFQLGRIFAGTGPSVTVPYTNVGKATLLLSRASVPGGGRVLSGLQVPVEPGQTGALEVSVAVPRDPGPFEQTVSVHGNGRPPEQTFFVKGTAWRPLRVQPGFIDLGRIDPDLNLSTQAVMRIELDEPVKLVSASAPNPGFGVALREVTPQKLYELVVHPTAALTPGAQQTALMVNLQRPVPAGWPETLAFAARATVERAVSVVPARMLVPSGPLPAERNHQFLVKCTDGTPDFSIRGVVFEGGPAFTQPEVQAGARPGEFVVRVVLPAGWSLPPPPVEARLVIRTSHPRIPTLEIPVAFQNR